MGLHRQDLIDDEALPGRTRFGVGKQLPLRADAEEPVQKPAVAHVRLGRLDLPLAQVGVPRLELTDQVRVREQVEVVTHRLRPQAQRRRSIRGAPGLGVEVGDDGPETAQCRGRHSDAPLRQVALEDVLDELPPPRRAVGFVAAEIRPREASPAPQHVCRVGARLVESEPSHHDTLCPPGQTLGRLAQQIARCAAHYQEPGGGGRPVRQDPERGEQVGAALHLVDDDESLERPQRRHRLVKAGQTRRVFEVEVVDGVGSDEQARQGGLAALARPGQDHYRAAVECRLERSKEARPRDHASSLS